ncbi:MAG: hypothetical protein IJE07_10540 [Clostridia bacterium]|nr:hypothetical protein [Clostridia bacterium]
MEQYLRRRHLADWADGLGVMALLYAGAVLWFTFLWGLGVPALLAGAALGTLLAMARLKWRQRRVKKREAAMRRRLGAEMLLEDLLLSPADVAHRRAAELLGHRWPLEVQQVTADGALCRLGEETLLVTYLRMLPDGALSAGDVAGAQRAVRLSGAARGVLCVPGKTPPAVLARADEGPVMIRIVGRDVLLDLAGRLHPATDEQLIALGQRRRRHLRGGVLALVFRRDKARRYFAYGLGMTLLYLLMGMRVYAVAGLVCLTMAVLCRTGRGGDEAL